MQETKLTTHVLFLPHKTWNSVVGKPTVADTELNSAEKCVLPHGSQPFRGRLWLFFSYFHCDVRELELHKKQ